MTDTRDVENKLRELASDPFFGGGIEERAAKAIRQERERAERAEAALREINKIGDNWYPRSLDASVKDFAVNAIGRMKSAAVAVLPAKEERDDGPL